MGRRSHILRGDGLWRHISVMWPINSDRTSSKFVPAEVQQSSDWTLSILDTSNHGIEAHIICRHHFGNRSIGKRLCSIVILVSIQYTDYSVVCLNLVRHDNFTSTHTHPTNIFFVVSNKHAEQTINKINEIDPAIVYACNAMYTQICTQNCNLRVKIIIQKIRQEPEQQRITWTDWEVIDKSIPYHTTCIQIKILYFTKKNKKNT